MHVHNKASCLVRSFRTNEQIFLSKLKAEIEVREAVAIRDGLLEPAVTEVDLTDLNWDHSEFA